MLRVSKLCFLPHFGSESIKVSLRVSFDNNLSQYHKIHFALCYSKVLYDINNLSKSIQRWWGLHNKSNFVHYLFNFHLMFTIYQIRYLLQLNYHVTYYRTIRNNIVLLTLTRLRDHSASKFTSSFVYITQVYWSNIFEDIGS